MSFGPASESFFASKASFTVKLKVLSGFGNLEDFYELVGSDYLVGLTCSKSCWNVLDVFRDEDERLTLGARMTHHILIYKTFDMELSEHEFLPGFIEAYHAPVFMNLSFWILWLRVVRTLVLHLKKLVVQNEPILTLNL